MTLPEFDSLGEKIYWLRVQLNMTLREMAKELGFSPSTICLWESNARLPQFSSYQILFELAKKHKISVDRKVFYDWLFTKE